MDAKPTVSAGFGPDTEKRLALAGTVALPYPPPASGPVFLGINPAIEGSPPSALPRFYLRVVQVVSTQLVIIRIFDLDELKAVGLPGDPSKDQPVARVVQPVDNFAQQIADAKKGLVAATQGENAVYEQILFPDAVLYVPEATPVLVLLRRSIWTVTAGLALLAG